MHKIHTFIKSSFIYILLFIFLLAVIFPFFISLMVSLKTNVEVITQPLAFPNPPQFKNYLKTIRQGNLITRYKNSLTVTIASLVSH